MKEIDDNEIRVIGLPSPQPSHGRWWVVMLILVVLVVIVAVVLGKESREEPSVDSLPKASKKFEGVKSTSDNEIKVSDTVIDDVPLTLYWLPCLLPEGANTSLQTGMPDMEDTSLLLAVMAADIRADNGGIVGDFVINGQVLARGERKEGYCAIFDGVPVLGCDGKAALERVMAEKGSFFRQYVLVCDGEALPPTPKGKNHRRALCVMGHSIFVAASADRESYHDFSTALADLGVGNAIALVGSESLLVYRAEGGLLHSVGTAVDSPNVNFFVWRR